MFSTYCGHATDTTTLNHFNDYSTTLYNIFRFIVNEIKLKQPGSNVNYFQYVVWEHELFPTVYGYCVNIIEVYKL